MASKDIKKTGRVPNSKVHLLDVRAYSVRQHSDQGYSNIDIAFIFNVHPSQITRILNKN